MPVEQSFIQTVLSPYIGKGCVYMKTAANMVGEKGASTRVTFSIPQSCYINSTGHFNAVELNICYNQMFYVLVADGVRRRAIPEMHDWNMEHFLDRRLPGMLIVRLSSKFRRPIDPNGFWADGKINAVIVRPAKRITFLRTSATFADANGGFASADADFALLL